VTTSIIAHNLVNKSHHNDKKEILKLKKGDDSSNEYLYVKVCEITYVHDTDSEIDIYLVGDREIKSTGDGHNHYQQ
jgi:hypothetical protein